MNTRQAVADADILIVSAAMEKSPHGETVVAVGTDRTYWLYLCPDVIHLIRFIS